LLDYDATGSDRPGRATPPALLLGEVLTGMVATGVVEYGRITAT
jgi:hypothetical protein